MSTLQAFIPPPSESYYSRKPSFRCKKFSEVHSPLEFVTVLVTLGRR